MIHKLLEGFGVNIKSLLSVNRWKRELRTPTRKITKFILDFFFSVCEYRYNRRDLKVEGVLIWDSSLNPITFDFLWYSYQAWFYFIGKGCSNFSIILFTPVLKAELKTYDEIVLVDEQINRIKNLIEPMASLLDCTTSVRRFYDFDEVRKIIDAKNNLIFPAHYSDIYRPYAHCYKSIYKNLKYSDEKTINLPKFLEFSPFVTRFESNKVKKFLRNLIVPDGIKSPAYITISLRDYGWRPDRNSQQEDIDKAYELAEFLELMLIIIPDEKEKLDSYCFRDNVLIVPEARDNLYLRMFLYDSSTVNIFLPSGPLQLCCFLPRAKGICVNWGCSGPDGSREYYQSNFGLKTNDQPHLSTGVYLVWNALRADYSLTDLLTGLDKLNILKFSNPTQC